LSNIKQKIIEEGLSEYMNHGNELFFANNDIELEINYDFHGSSELLSINWTCFHR